MKHVLVTLALAFLAIEAFAQPTIQWQKSLGGSKYDEAYSVKQTHDGGYVIAGFTLSNDGDVTNHDIGYDYWIVKLNYTGELEWQKTLGGSNNERAYAIDQTQDGGYIVAGSTLSNNGDITFNHGSSDCWIVKLNSAGDLEWQKSFGGSAIDDAKSILQTSDGGYVFTGYSTSNDGDVSGNHGGSDYWVVKLNNAGHIIWQKTFGGSNLDQAHSIRQTLEGGYILVGETLSNDGDISINHGNIDYWVVKLSETGQLEWEITLGGENLDVGEDVLQNEAGDFLVMGYESSYNTGNVTGSHGGFDYWVIKLSQSGNILWQKTYGGSSNDWGRSISKANDGEFILAGATDSTDSDVLDNDGGLDAFIVKIDSAGEILWKKTFGGTNGENINSIIPTNDHGFVFTGYSWSSDGDATLNHGDNDFWIVKLAPEAVPTTAPNIAPLEIYPNPTHNTITLQTTAHEPDLQITITDMLGRTIQHQPIQNGKNVDVSTLASGMYIITATAPSGKTYSGTFKKA